VTSETQPSGQSEIIRNGTPCRGPRKPDKRMRISAIDARKKTKEKLGEPTHPALLSGAHSCGRRNLYVVLRCTHVCGAIFFPELRESVRARERERQSERDKERERGCVDNQEVTEGR
jgi:hypothetical protein